ncbi:formate--tetrahydrofolate ligase, partial [Vibrio xuii]
MYALKPGQPIPDTLFEQDHEALKAGFENLKWHINNVNKYGIPAVVAINRFPQDSEEELLQLKAMIEMLPNNVEVAISEGFASGGEGTLDLAQKVVLQTQRKVTFTPLYRLEQTTEEKLMAVAEAVYGAARLTLSEKAKEQVAE